MCFSSLCHNVKAYEKLIFMLNEQQISSEAVTPLNDLRAKLFPRCVARKERERERERDGGNEKRLNKTME